LQQKKKFFIARSLLFSIAMPIICRRRFLDMTPQDVIAHFGTQVKTAQALGIKQSSIAGWIKKGEVPEGRQYQIQLLTGGKLQAERKAA
jgi:hypothetical protein